jgi:hypothetical protein
MEAAESSATPAEEKARIKNAKETVAARGEIRLMPVSMAENRERERP